MSTTDFILGAMALIIVSIGLRSLPLILWRFNPTDAWSHIYLADLIRSHGGLPKLFDRAIPLTEVSYPPAISVLLSKINPRRPIHWGILFNIGLAAVELMLAAIFTAYLVRAAGIETCALTAGLVAASVYATLPYVFSSWSGFDGLSGRPLGVALANIATLALCFGSLFNLSWYLLTVLCVAALVFISKFGVQATILSALATAVLFLSWWPIFCVAAGLALSVVASGGLGWRILRGSVAHTTFYGRFLQYHHNATINHVWPLRRWVVETFKQPGLRRMATTAYWTPILRLLFLVPWIGPAGLWVLMDESRSPAINGLAGVAAVALAVVPIITSRHLRFLGEPDRYFTFIALMPLAVLVGISVPTTPLGWAVFGGFHAICFSVVTVMIATRHIMDKKSAKMKKTGQGIDQDVVDFMNAKDNADEQVILTIPTNLIQIALRQIRGRFVGMLFNAPIKRSGQRLLEKLFPELYPFPKNNPDMLRSEFNVDYIICAKYYTSSSYIERHGIPSDSVDFSKLPVVFESESYAVYSLASISKDTSPNDRSGNLVGDERTG